MSLTNRATALLVLALALSPALKAQSDTCNATLKSWTTRLKALPSGPPVKRMRDIQTLAASFNDAEAQCIYNEVDKALEAEQKELIQLTIGGRAVKPEAVYLCRTLTQDLQCNADTGDGTAHLGENPNAIYLNIPPGKTKLVLAPEIDESRLRLFVADEKSLHDKPKYVRVPLRQKTFDLPTIKSSSVLIVIFHEPDRTGLIGKAVWLLAPNGRN